MPEDDYDVNDPNKKSVYYKVSVTCDNDVQGEWDYNAWNLKLNNLDNQANGANGTKCKLAFNDTQDGGMSSTERDNIIKQGVQTRRNTYRGKDITTYFNNGSLFEMIKSGKFDDIYVGDYIISNINNKWNSKIMWLIADLDNYLGEGGQKKITTHHATIIPDGVLTSSFMNSNLTTEGGYIGSEMYKTVLPEVLKNYIMPDFNNHIITYQNILSNSMDSTKMNMFNLTSGASSNWEWAERQLDLMSEVNVYGTTIVSSSLYDTGLDNRQYAIFQLNPKLISQNYVGQYMTYWLKGVATSQFFTANYTGGDLFYGFAGADHVIGVRPRFLID